MAIEKRGDGWCVRWRRLDGGTTRTQCASRRAAEKVEIAIAEAHEAGREYDAELRPPPEELAVVDVIKAYQESRNLRCAESTLRVEAHHINLFARFLVGKFGPTPRVSVLSRQTLDEFLAWLRKASTGLHGRARSMVTATKSIEAAQRLWRWADDSGRWPGQIPRARTVELPRVPPSMVVAPTWDEMDACVLACDPDGWQRKLATWLRYTGLRAGESMLLTWEDVDVPGGVLTIRPEIDKMKRGRVVPLSKLVLDEISGWGRRVGWLIPTRRKSRDPRARDILRAWKRAGVRETVWKRRPEHAFRRGFKSGLLQLGASPDAVDFLQGHQLGAGSRGRYIDGQALPLRETVAMVPRVGAASNVVQMKRSEA